MIRWQAEITYRSRWGLIHKSVDLEEIGCLQEVVEEGPHWDTIAAINIRRFKPFYPELTVEQAEVQTPEMVRRDLSARLIPEGLDSWSGGIDGELRLPRRFR